MSNTMIEERDEFMVSSNDEHNTPKQRKAHFLKPTLDPNNPTFPKPPSLSLSSIPFFKQLNSWVTFRGSPQPQESWGTWVANLQLTHQAIWEKVGIFDAIRASTYKIKRDNELIIGLAEKWCPLSNTFVFSWGECSITLEDVMILGGFSVLGNCVQNPEDEENNSNLFDDVMPEIKKNSSGAVGQCEWMDYFMSFGGELEHIALLVMWLSKYVFTTNHYKISPSVFPIAISLAKGNKVALAPAVLAFIYRDLGLLKQKIVDFVNARNDIDDLYRELVLLAPFQIVQLWVWERFPTLCPKPMSLLPREPRLARWKTVNKLQKFSMMNIETLGESFLWRPYGLCVENWEFPEFYGDEERFVLMNSEVGDELFSFARCLRSCELVGLDCIEHYRPHRVARQFGLDQDIPRWNPRFKDTVKLAWRSYDMPLDGEKLFLASLMARGGVTVRYSDWSRTAFCGENDNVSVLKKRKSPRYKNLDDYEMDNTKCNAISLTSLCNVPLASSFAHELCIEEIQSSKTNNNLNKSLVNNANPIPNLETAISNAVSAINSSIEKVEKFRVDLLMEKLEKCREICLKMSKVGESRGMVLKRSRYEALTADNEDRSELESHEGEAERCVNVNGSVDDPVIIEDDRESGDLVSFFMRSSELEARICWLESVVSKMKAGAQS